jgi:folate-binding protein YgfZ
MKMPDLTPPAADSTVMPIVCPHTGLGLLKFAGDDAVAFLHGQVSSDVQALAAGQGQYWSYNSPKGRMLANGVLWRSPAHGVEAAVWMLLASDLVETIHRRLAMFILRAKVSIEDATDAHAVLGLAGDGRLEAVRDALGIAPAPSTAVSFGGGAMAYALADRRLVIVAPAADAPIVQAALARHASVAGVDRWRFSNIAAGVPWLSAATSDRFVPQMANWDLLGGISFQKGCYPGQEIVARMKYLGRLKERLFAFHTDALAVPPATPLYSAAFGAEQACGSVVDAAPAPAGGTALLAVVQISAADANDLTLGTREGPRLSRRALPYDVPGPAMRERPSAR